YLSDYAGGVALIQEPKARGVDLITPDPVKSVNETLGSVNEKLAKLEPGLEMKINFEEGLTKYPSYPITLSAVGTAVRKADELIAWPSFAKELKPLSEDMPARLKLARTRIETRLNVPALKQGR